MRRDPKNPEDADAIGVFIGGCLVGYIDRDTAVTVRHHLAHEGVRKVDARIVEVRRRHGAIVVAGEKGYAVDLWMPADLL